MDYSKAASAMLEGEGYAALSSVLDRVTHDFGNLLMPLLEYPRFLRGKVQPDDPQAPVLLDQMEKAAETMADISRDLALLVHGNGERCMRMDMNSLAREALDESRRTAEQAEIETVFEASPVPLMVVGRYDQLFLAVLHVCRNAFEAVGTQGEVQVKAHRLSVTPGDAWSRLEIPTGDYAAIHVRDSGPGIPPEVSRTLFDPFITTRKSSKRRGAGIGLSLVYRALRDHQGTILYRAEGAPGAEFLLLLPETDAQDDNA